MVPPRTSLSEPAPARTVNIHDRKFVDRVFSDMRSIAHLNENDRPSVQGTEGGISIDRYVAWTSAPFSRGFQAWKRFSTNDGRAACLVKVKSTIDTMILIVHEWALEKARMKQREIEKREAAESGRPTVMEQMEDKKARCDIDLNLANALDSLESGKLGVEALKKTYGSDQATLSDLEVTLLKITNELTKIRACLPVAEMLS